MKEWLLEMGFHLTDKIELYFPNADKPLIGGDLLPFGKREYRNFIFPLLVEPDKSYTFYIRFEATAPMKLPLTIWSHKAFNQKTNIEGYIFGFYYGIIFVMFMYNLVLFVFLKDRNYLYYVLYIGSFCLFQFTDNGLGYQHLWSDYPWWNERAIQFLACLGLIWGIIFSKKFLNTKKLVPKLDKVFTLLLGISLVTLVISLFNHTERFTHLMVNLLALPVPIVAITISYLSFKRFRPARFFLIGWTFLLSGLLIYGLASFNILPTNLLTQYGMQIGSAIEVILLSLALGDRISILRQEKDKAQSEAIKNQQLAIDNLQQSDKLKEEFLANINHEIRTPMNGILGMTELTLSTNLNPEQRDNLKIVLNCANSLMQLHNDLLDFSLLKNTKLFLKITSVDIHDLTDKTFLVSNSLIDDKPLKLINSVDPNLPPVAGDLNRLQQIMHNLVGNAIKFSNKGTIEVNAKVIDSHIEIIVSDTGIGIPENNFDLIFDSFQQGDEVISKEYGGAGLGLSISKRLIELHSGKIWLESTVGEGSTFTFTLPISPDKSFKRS